MVLDFGFMKGVPPIFDIILHILRVKYAESKQTSPVLSYMKSAMSARILSMTGESALWA